MARLGDRLKAVGDSLDRAMLVRAVRAKRGIPSKDEPEFSSWQKQYLARAQPAEPESVSSTSKKVDAVELQGQDFAKELNVNLLNQTSPDAAFSIPIATLKGYLTAIAGDRLIYEGNITLNEDGNGIVIKGLKNRWRIF